MSPSKSPLTLLQVDPLDTMPDRIFMCLPAHRLIFLWALSEDNAASAAMLPTAAQLWTKSEFPKTSMAVRDLWITYFTYFSSNVSLLFIMSTVVFWEQEQTHMTITKFGLWFHIFTIKRFLKLLLFSLQLWFARISSCLCACCLNQTCCLLVVGWSLLTLTTAILPSSACGTLKMVVPNKYCRAAKKAFALRKKEAKGTDAEQILKEVRGGVKAALK